MQSLTDRAEVAGAGNVGSLVYPQAVFDSPQAVEQSISVCEEFQDTLRTEVCSGVLSLTSMQTKCRL